MEKKILLIGASGHGKVVADIAIKNGYEVIGFLDDNPEIKELMNIPVIGKVSEAVNYVQEAFLCVSIGNANARKRIMEELIQQGAQFPVLIHPNSVVGMNVNVDLGTVIMAGTVINPCTNIGKGCIINTGSTVDHDCTLGDYTHIAVGAHLAGTIHVEESVWIGAGAIVRNNISICAESVIGAGAVVVKNITEKGTYVGVPARMK